MMQTVKVPLASNALYVSGTVNGVDKVWTREEGNVWWTTADRADDGVYRIALSIVYGDGKTTEDSITLYYGLQLVTDRTAQDVADRTEKGFYNVVDLNRVGAAMVYLRDRFNENGYDLDIIPKTDWREVDAPTESGMTLYLSCLGTLRGALYMPYGTPETPDTMKGLTYTTANNIEKILETVDQMLTLAINAVWYSGEIYSGEVM